MSERHLHSAEQLTVEDDHAVRNLAQLYGCTVQHVRDAIHRHGPSRVAVELALASSAEVDECA